jgi:hypothetical protein
MIPPVVKLMRFASVAICLIVAVSFGIFAFDETRNASAQQRQELVGETAAQPSPASPATTHKTQSWLHRDIERVATAVTSPFSGVVDEASGEWAVRAVKLLLALLVYGFGLGYLARTLRVRV